ncbi:hypothetical protein [Mucilaginibacter psychrotolerans]|uniref:VCBS repeat-containing protein n=1 Tax=Mucilaginibacter psychrotolerans TaxID=1524096 RepID=A0A4Y8SMX6_9SPHI|nr:hypothetical protein [Mucilaginibacter psychrotolerans]TFF39774.1 hypothetical protein E2R66_05255 [Mucilaginibacter psychrotolerans]
MNARIYVYAASVCILIAACGNDSKPPSVAVSTPATPALTEPFRYHKAIEVSPGQTFDVLSWGRGAKMDGSFMILHSDSAGVKFTTTTGDLDGAISDVYNSDMDTDGNPEILIQARDKDTVNYAKIYAFEFNNNNANKLDFPKLTGSQKKGYRGNDNFYIKEGLLIREFPIYSSNDSLAKPTGAKRVLQYGLRNNSFSVQQLSKDSVSLADKAAAAAAVNKKKTTADKPVKKKKAETKKKRRRRRG